MTVKLIYFYFGECQAKLKNLPYLRKFRVTLRLEYINSDKLIFFDYCNPVFGPRYYIFNPRKKICDYCNQVFGYLSFGDGKFTVNIESFQKYLQLIYLSFFGLFLVVLDVFILNISKK